MFRSLIVIAALALAGVALPRLELVALEPSAPAKVELALARLPA